MVYTSLKYILGILTLLMLFSMSHATLQVEVLQTNPSPIVAGEYADISIRITNSQINDLNNRISNIDVKVDENSYVSFIESDLNTISSLLPGESITQTLRVYFDESTPEGFFPLPIVVNFDSTELVFFEKIYVQGFKSRADLFVNKVSATPQILIKDSTYNSIQVELVNMGERDSKLTSVTLQEVEGVIQNSYSFSNQDSIGTIQSGEVETATFVIDILENAPQNIETTLHLVYQEEIKNNSFVRVEKELPVVIELSQVPDFEVVSVEQIGEFKHETPENVVKITLKNIGKKTAEDVRVRIVPDKSYPFIFEEVVVYSQSQVKSGDEFVVEFVAEVSSGNSKDYQLQIDIESLLNFDTFIEDEYITITTQDNVDNFNRNYIFIIVVIILIFTAIIGIRKLRSNREENMINNENSGKVKLKVRK